MKFYAKEEFFIFQKGDLIPTEWESHIELWYKRGHVVSEEERKAYKEMHEKVGNEFSKESKVEDVKDSEGYIKLLKLNKNEQIKLLKELKSEDMPHLEHDKILLILKLQSSE